MEQTGINAACEAALKKLAFFKYRARYFVYSGLAGCFCAMGMALACSVAAGVYSSEAIRGMYKFMLAFMFTLSFTMIIFAGSELFTGNVLVMTIASLQKKIKFSQGLRLLAFCYFANISGGFLMSIVIAQTGILTGQTGEMVVSLAGEKAALSFAQAFFRGVMCNTMVCLGTWCVLKLKSESAKLIILFWAVTGFVALGYEHSIANAALFTMAAFAESASEMNNWQGVFFNMLSCTLGNIAGGSLFVGFVYWFSGRDGQNLTAA